MAATERFAILKVRDSVNTKVKVYCNKHGLSYLLFVEKALLGAIKDD